MASKSLVLGFLTVRQEGHDSLRGGYLLATQYGRPVEFHYTDALAIPSAHRALYGASFEPYVYGEIFGKALTDRQSMAPRIVLVDSPGLLALRRHVPAPVVWIESAKGPTQSDQAPKLKTGCLNGFEQDLAAFERIESIALQGFDWLEPFSRLDDALRELGANQTSAAA